jgi:hypothetical protein
MAVFGSGCASIIKGGGAQAISIRSNPSEASVKIFDFKTGNALSTGTTPFIATLEKSHGFFSGAKYRVVIEKQGFATREVIVDSNANGWYIGGNLVFGGLIGWLIVDPATGAMWTLDPDQVSVDLQSAPPPPAAAQASAPVSVLEVDDFATLHPNLLNKLKRIY